MIHLATPDLSGNESRYLQECIQSTFVSSVGPFVDKFEENVAEKIGATYAVATSSGTTGLHLALTAAGVQSNELVLLPSFTFIASANAISHCGASPWLVDVSKDSWSLDPELLEKTLEKNTIKRDTNLYHTQTGKRIAAIMPVYTMGCPAHMERINAIGKHYNLPVIADAAAAIGAEFKNKPIGNIADISVMSFNGNKTITSGGGGMVVGNNKKILDLARHLSTTARHGKDYNHDMVGFNYRMTNVQAAIGCAQLERLEEFLSAKKRIDKTYRQQLKNIEGISFFPAPSWAVSSCWFTGITINSPELPSVAELCTQLQHNGIGARSFWKPVHLQKPYATCPQTKMLVSETLWHRVLTLPCSTHLTEKEQDTVVSVLENILH